MNQRPAEATDLSALSPLAPELAATFVSVASDIALVIDTDGVIRRVALGANRFTSTPDDWVGKAWADTVTDATRQKILQLLSDVGSAGVSRSREVNHPSPGGADIPVAYAAVRLGAGGPVLAVGRDLRAIAAIQQRFVESQQEMERGYWKLRQAELRYRLLFQVATDAVCVVDALSLNTVEANRAAVQLFDLSLDDLVGQPLATALEPTSQAAVQDLFAAVRAGGRAGELRARVAASGALIELSATPFRGESGMLLLVRARATEGVAPTAMADLRLADFVERTPDAVVLTDSVGRVLMGNPAFAGLCELSTETEVQGRWLADWAELPGRGFGAIVNDVRRHGLATQVDACIHGRHGGLTPVELSAVLLDDGDQECLGFTIRPLPRRRALGPQGTEDLGAAIERLGAQLGRLPLPDLVLEATRIAERHVLRMALEQARGERDVAAGLLGVERDELDQRLLHHGLLSGAAGSGTPPHASRLN